MRFALPERLFATAMVVAALLAAAAPCPAPPPPVVPVESAATPRTASQVAFDDWKRQLDRITIETHESGLSEEEFAALRRELQQVRDGVRAEIERIEPRLQEIETRLTQLGP